jgi:hypothetical protein
MSQLSTYYGTDVIFPLAVRNDNESLIDLTTATSIEFKIGTNDVNPTGIQIITATGLDGTGAYNATVAIANTEYTLLPVGTYKYQLVLENASNKVTIEDEGTLQIKAVIPDPVTP